MLTFLFGVMMFMVFGKIIFLAFKCTWGIAKVVLTIVFLPIILVCMVFGGLIYIALPILAIVGIVALLDGRV